MSVCSLRTFSWDALFQSLMLYLNTPHTHTHLHSLSVSFFVSVSHSLSVSLSFIMNEQICSPCFAFTWCQRFVIVDLVHSMSLNCTPSPSQTHNLHVLSTHAHVDGVCVWGRTCAVYHCPRTQWIIHALRLTHIHGLSFPKIPTAA